MYRKICLAWVCVWLWSALPAAALTVFYVDPDYGGANGASDGSAARPWLAMDDTDVANWAAVNVALASDAVVVYFSALDSTGTASEESPVSLTISRTDAGTNRLTLDGMSYYNTNDATPGVGTWVAHPDPPTWPGNIRGLRHKLLDNPSSLMLGWPDSYGKQHYITMRGFEMNGGSDSRARWGGSFTVMEFIWTHDLTAVGAQMLFAPAWEWETNGPGNEDDTCIAYGISTDLTIRYNVIERGYGEALYMHSNYQPVIGTEANPCVGLDGHSGLLIEHNYIDQAGLTGEEGDGVDLKAGWDNVLIRNNTIIRSQGPSTDGATAITLVGRYTTGPANIIIENNILGENESRAAIQSGAYDGVIIRNNVIYSSGGAGITTTAPSGMPAPANTIIYNNTVYNCGPLSGATIPQCIAALANTNTQIFNNVVADLTPANAPIFVGTGNTADYNVIGDKTSSGSGHGPNTIYVASSAGFFVDAAGGDFRLAASSPAINAGTDLSATGFDADILGVTRPYASAWDAGAYEWMPAPAAFVPPAGSPLALGQHPRLLMTRATIPALRNAIATYYLARWNTYLAYVVNAELTNESGEISHQGLHFVDHNIFRTREAHHCLIYALGDVPGATYPQTRAWHADRAITSALTKLTADQRVGPAAAVVYDWCWDAMTVGQRSQMATLISTAAIKRNESNVDITMNSPSYVPQALTSSQYYESAHPYWMALATYGDGFVDTAAASALSTFATTMLQYGYNDALNWVCRGGGWDECFGYSNWHPRIHLYNLWAWATATGQNYLNTKGAITTQDAGLCFQEYAKFIWYAVDPWRYTDSKNSYMYVTLGGAEVGTDPLISDNRSQKELLFAMPRALMEAGLYDEAGLVRHFLDHHDVTDSFVSDDFEQHWVGGWLGVAATAAPIMPDSLGLPLYNWSPNIGLFLARTGFGRPFDTVFAITGGHFSVSGLRGVSAWDEVSLTKFGPLLGAARAGHRSLSNLAAYPGGQEQDSVFFAGSHFAAPRTSLKTQVDMQNILTGTGSYDNGGIEQVVAEDSVFYHVRLNYDRRFDGTATHKRQAVFIPGPDPERDSDFLVLHDQSTGSTLASLYFHVPWEPEIIGETGTASLVSGSGVTGRIGTEYTGTSMVTKARNDVLGNEAATDNCTDAPSALNAHGILLHKALLPTGHTYRVTRVDDFDANTCNRSGEFPLMNRRWQVAVTPTAGTGTQTFLNVYQTGDSAITTGMQTLTLLNPGTPTQGVFIERLSSAHNNYVVVFNSAGGQLASPYYSYTIAGSGTTRHIITGLVPGVFYRIQETTDSSTDQTIQAGIGTAWDYKGVVANVTTGTLRFDAPNDGGNRTYTIAPVGAPAGPATRVQTHVRAYTVHTAEGTSPLAALNTAITVQPSATVRARFQTQTTSAAPAAVGYLVACSDNGGSSYYQVADDYQGNRVRYGLDNAISTGTATTRQLTDLGTTFRAGYFLERGVTSFPAIAVGQNEFTELEAVLQVDPTAANYSVQCRLEEADRTPLTTYANLLQVSVVPTPPSTGGQRMTGVVRSLARAFATQYEYTIYKFNSYNVGADIDGDCTETDWVGASPLPFATNNLAGGAAGSVTTAKMLWDGVSRICWCFNIADTARITETVTNDTTTIYNGEDGFAIILDTNKEATTASNTTKKVVGNFGTPGAILDAQNLTDLTADLNVTHAVGGVANTNNVHEGCMDITPPGDAIILLNYEVEDSDTIGVTGSEAIGRGTTGQINVLTLAMKTFLSQVPAPDPADVIAPVVSGCAADQVTTSSVRVTCSVDDNTANCTLRADSTLDDDMSDAPLYATSPIAVANGSCALTMTGLMPGSGYNLQMEAADPSNNIGLGAVLDVTTSAAATSCHRYASPSGTGDGLTAGTPYQIASFWAQAQANSSVRVLCLNDGVYTSSTSMINPPDGLSGTAAVPITVRAVNDGAVRFNGQAVRFPVSLSTSTNYYLLEGFDAHNSGIGDVIQVSGTGHIVRRVVAWDAGGTSVSQQWLQHPISFHDCRSCLGEDLGAFGKGWRTILVHRSLDTTLRRVWSRFNSGFPDNNGNGPPGKALETSYRAHRTRVENSIFTRHVEPGQPGNAGDQEVLGIGCVNCGTPEDPLLGEGDGYLELYASLVYVRNADTNNNNAPARGLIWDANWTSDINTFRDVVSWLDTAHTGTRALRLQNVTGQSTVQRLTTISPTTSTIGTGWSVTDWDNYTSIAAAGGALDIWDGAGQANLCFRTVNGVLTGEPLFPWPMDSRISAALTTSGRSVTSVFGSSGSLEGMLEAAFGSIPPACGG